MMSVHAGLPDPTAVVEPIDDATPAATVDPVRLYATLTFVRGALASLVIALCAGIMAVLFYVPATAPHVAKTGLEFASLRPIHTTFASAWIFLGGIAVVHRYLQDHAGLVRPGERWRLRIQIALWAIAGLGVLASLPAGVTSGREYTGFHPAISLAILLGWLMFAWNFFAATWRGFWRRPVYVTMWGVGVLFFIYTFIEQHAWLLIVDLRLQWKSCGTLVGSFNLFVYGTLYYVGEKLSGDGRFANSRLAYALLGIGLLNSFTNYGHHTYHVPQAELIKWVAFAVSMLEVLILARVIWDIARLLSRRAGSGFRATVFFLNAARWWTLGMLFSSLLISIPPLNSLIHGTQVVTAHAMGTEIGIDSMALFAALCWLLSEFQTRRTGSSAPVFRSRVRCGGIGLNVCAATLVIWLSISGAIVGYTRYQHLPPPEWLRVCSPYVFALAGIGTATFLFALLWTWIRLAYRPFRVGSDHRITD